MQLANQVDGVHLDVEIKASRSPPGAANDAFLGGGGEFHTRLPTRVCGSKGARHHHSWHAPPLVAAAAFENRNLRAASTPLERLAGRSRALGDTWVPAAAVRGCGSGS